ncbi:MAG: hypothetical protein QW639_00605 [Candidatus Bathyarchaeia archaeon]
MKRFVLLNVKELNHHISPKPCEDVGGGLPVALSQPWWVRGDPWRVPLEPLKFGAFHTSTFKGLATNLHLSKRKGKD